MKPIPASRMQVPTCAALRSILTPSACRTSAAPDFDDSARLPCLATGTPAPATINAAHVEILNEPDASPPVPTTSTAPGGALTPRILDRMVVTAPVISSTVSPRTRSAINKPPICDGVASPDIMRSKAPAASSRVRLAPVATLAMSALNSSAMAGVSGSRANSRSLAWGGDAAPVLGIPGGSDIQKILQYQMPVLGSDAFGMELHAVNRKRVVNKSHHELVFRFGIYFELDRYRCPIDHERMITRRFQGTIDATKESRACMLDLGHLAVNRCRAHHLAAE